MYDDLRRIIATKASLEPKIKGSDASSLNASTGNKDNIRPIIRRIILWLLSRGRTADVSDMQTVSLERAVAMIPDGASLMIGGFMATGTPERVVDEIVRQNKRNLTLIANDTASPGRGIGKLIAAKLVRKAIVSHIGLNPETQRQMTAGELEVELVPQGTLVERIRAGGYGLGGVLTQTGIGTTVEKGKQQIKVDGKTYLLRSRASRGLCLGSRVSCRLSGQPQLRADRPQLQSDHRDGRRQGYCRR